MSAVVKILKEKYQIFNKNAITFVRIFEDKCIDLIIANPPYFEIKGKFDFVWTNQAKYLDWSKEWFLEAKRILNL